MGTTKSISAYTNFSQTFDEIDLLPFIIRDDFKHSQYANPLAIHIPYFDIFTFGKSFLVQHSETSDSRPYATIPTIETHTTPADTLIQINDPNELLSDTSESQVQHPQQNPLTTQPITQTNEQLEKLSLQPNENPNNDNNQYELQNPNPTLDTQSIALTADSNAQLVPLRSVEGQKIRPSTEQDPQHLFQCSSILSTTNTTITQPQIQLTTTRNHDPAPQPEYDTNTSFSISQQPSSSHININGLLTNTCPQFTFQHPSTSEVHMFQHIHILQHKILLIQICHPHLILI